MNELIRRTSVKEKRGDSKVNFTGYFYPYYRVKRLIWRGIPLKGNEDNP